MMKAMKSVHRRRRDRVEIIPLEPDQRSDLRREAPVSPTFIRPILGPRTDSLMPFSFLTSKSLDISRFARPPRTMLNLG